MEKIIATAEALNTGEVYSTNIKARQHSFIIDEPIEVGGKDLAPSPGDYLCASLASCKAITLRMYANRKGWKVDTIKVKVELVKADTSPGGNNTFLCELTVSGSLDDKQRERLLEISKACPIQRLLVKPSEVVSTLIEFKAGE